jgi:hypothetical protein
MKFLKIAKSKMQALAKYLFRKCRTLQRIRHRAVTNFVDRLEIVIHDFIRRDARHCFVRIAAHMHIGNLVGSRMTRRKWNWYEANRNHWHCKHSAGFCDLWLLYKLSRQREKNYALFLSAYDFWFIGHETEFFLQFHKLCYLNVGMIQHGTWSNLKRFIFPNVWQMLWILLSGHCVILESVNALPVHARHTLPVIDPSTRMGWVFGTTPSLL